MKAKYLVAVLLIILSVIITICLLPSLKLYIKDVKIRPKQEELAKKFGVNIQDYPYESSFPVGYFDNVLRPGMSLDEVHEIVRGYEAVYLCFGFAELYYYYGDNKDNAVVFMISFDENNNFVDITSVTFGSNSSAVGPVVCSSGLLNP